MLLSNMAVAQQIANYLPEQALLRRHEEPIERRLVAFQDRAERLGYKMDISSAGAFMKSFDAIGDQTARELLQILAYKSMHTAKYFFAPADPDSTSTESPMLARSSRIFDTYLPKADPELHAHLVKLDIVPQIFLL